MDGRNKDHCEVFTVKKFDRKKETYKWKSKFQKIVYNAMPFYLKMYVKPHIYT